MSEAPAPPDVARAVDELHRAAGDPPLPPLRLPELVASRRGGRLGAATTRLRGLVLRIIEPSLVDLVNQLERDRHRQRAEIARLEARIAALERGAGRPDG